MEPQEKRRKVSDARVLIKYLRMGYKLSAWQMEVVEKHRVKERIRQQNFRNARKVACAPKTRGRKPSAGSPKTGATVSLVADGLYLPDRIYQGFNDCNCHREIYFVPIESRLGATNRHTINSQIQRGASPQTATCLPLPPLTVSADMAEQCRSASVQFNASSPFICPAPHAGSLSVYDVYSPAASGTSPTPPCTSYSSINSSSFPSISSSQSPESSTFASQIGTSADECQVGLHEVGLASATSDPVVPILHMGFPLDVESREYGAVTCPEPSSAIGVLTHSICNRPEILQVPPKCSKLHRCELLPYHVAQLRGLLQAWSIPDKDRAFDEIVSFVNRMVAEAVDKVQLESTAAVPL
ncbi:hypothetical protein V1509DRAFT_630845 [Lipomyces kononenkoae]